MTFDDDADEDECADTDDNGEDEISSEEVEDDVEGKDDEECVDVLFDFKSEDMLLLLSEEGVDVADVLFICE